MKRIALSLAAAALAFLGAAPQASARPHSHGGYGPSTYVSSYARCGCPVYVQRYVAFYDGWGRPVWRTRVMPINHRCGWGRPAPRYYGGSGHYHGHGGYYPRSGVTIRASW